jgi:hypothetical protein
MSWKTHFVSPALAFEFSPTVKPNPISSCVETSASDT